MFMLIKIIKFQSMKLLLLALTLALALAAPAADRMDKIPGYPATYNTSIYTGYLDLKTPNRSIHYVFVESINGANNSDPVTLWLNGGPGCSSLLGFIQEIGPYYLQDGIDFKNGDNLTQNKYSWHTKSNLLFFQSPAGVGYSYNLQQNYSHNDAKTANDNLNALLDFFVKYPEYRKNVFFIAGQSYAGKYIPDLAVLIDLNNQYGEGQKINLKSIIIGNGVMTFRTLQSSTYQYMIDRRFVDPEIVPIYQSSCQTDPDSAGCRYFVLQFDKGTVELNPYNVYGYCYYNDSFLGPEPKQTKKRFYHSQESILEGIKKQMSKNDGDNKVTFNKYNGAPCAYFDGIYDYFHLNDVAWKAKFPGQNWNGPCADGIRYSIDPQGSMYSYRHLLGLMQSVERKISIVLYNGNWDAVVPYVDTLKGIDLLNLVPVYTYNPWFTDSQHSGFEQIFSGIIFITVKGASHQVPQSKRAEAFTLFDSIVQGHKSNYNFQNGVFGNKNKKASMI